MHSKNLDAEHLSDRWAISPDRLFELEGAYSAYLTSIHTRTDRPGVFHPSALGMCGRHNVYEYLGYQYDPKYSDMRTPEIFFLGHKLHEILQGRVSELGKIHGFRVLHEVPTPHDDFLKTKYGIGGTSDTLVEIPGEAGTLQRGVIEYKSISLDGFVGKPGAPGVKITKKPKEHHLEQLHIYMYRFNCPIGWIWYYCKNTSETLIIPVVFDDEVFHGALDKILVWKRYADKEQLPPREESWFGCKECKYKNTCQPSVLKRRSSNLAQVRSKYAKARR